jgi:hypothetical protein
MYKHEKHIELDIATYFTLLTQTAHMLLGSDQNSLGVYCSSLMQLESIYSSTLTLLLAEYAMLYTADYYVLCAQSLQHYTMLHALWLTTYSISSYHSICTLRTTQRLQRLAMSHTPSILLHTARRLVCVAVVTVYIV